VVYDPNLVDWQDPEQEIANLSAYSLYKIAVLHLIQGDADRARITFDLLDKRYLSQDFGYMYAELASVFRESYELEGLANACVATQEFAEGHSKEILSPLGSEIYGYANRDYFPNDICPWE
jgi:outer membrane protein assembly factor BamD (BamD/ComL family)